MSLTKQKISAEELLDIPDDGNRYELIQGELKKMSPAGHHHGRITMNLAIPLGYYVQQKKLGSLYAAETGFKIASDPDSVRAPDIAFIRKDRVEKVMTTKGFWQGAPDLAIEVVSPSDSFSEVEEKVLDWLNAGTLMVIVIKPDKKTATIYRSKTNMTILNASDELEGQDVVPGWKMKVADLFA